MNCFMMNNLISYCVPPEGIGYHEYYIVLMYHQVIFHDFQAGVHYCIPSTKDPNMNRSKSKHIFLRGYLIYRLVVLFCFFLPTFEWWSNMCPLFFKGLPFTSHSMQDKLARCLGDFPIFEGDGHPTVFRGLYYTVYIYIYLWVNYNDLTVLPHWKSWLVRGIIPKWP